MKLQKKERAIRTFTALARIERGLEHVAGRVASAQGA